MRLTTPLRFEQLGSIQIHEVQRVIELDAGSSTSTPSSLTVSRDELLAIESNMAIVVSCMNEGFKTLEALFTGIPHDCMIILVSNSIRQPTDRYQTEVNILRSFCRGADRFAIAIHQKDPAAAEGFSIAGAPDLVGDDGLIRDGKGEAMFMGMAVTALTGRKYIGFLDADNYVPGSALEYVKSYAAGFHLANTPDAMVRVSWSSKPKERNGKLIFDRRGRSSKIVNRWLNHLLQHYSGYGTECIATGNAGEHAMTMALGTKLQLAGGYSVEPYEYMYMFEHLSGLFDMCEGEQLTRSSVQVLQVETQNPHLHNSKGDEHVCKMWAQGLNTMYHSRIFPDELKGEMRQFMEDRDILEPGQEPPKALIYPAINTLDLAGLFRVLNSQARSFEEILGHFCPRGECLLRPYFSKYQ